jgi:hypothetical protein
MPYTTVLCVSCLLVQSVSSFTVTARARPVAQPRSQVCMNFLSDFFEELDRFVDDAAGRRLGNGAKFYGKRKSSFYGEDDQQRKKDPDKFDAEEDWRGPTGGSYFVPSPEKDELGRPLGFLTRKEARELKEKEREVELSRRGEQELVRAFRRARDAEEDAAAE